MRNTVNNVSNSKSFLYDNIKGYLNI